MPRKGRDLTDGDTELAAPVRPNATRCRRPRQPSSGASTGSRDVAVTLSDRLSGRHGLGTPAPSSGRQLSPGPRGGARHRCCRLVIAVLVGVPTRLQLAAWVVGERLDRLPRVHPPEHRPADGSDVGREVSRRVKSYLSCPRTAMGRPASCPGHTSMCSRKLLPVGRRRRGSQPGQLLRITRDQGPDRGGSLAGSTVAGSLHSVAELESDAREWWSP